MKNKIKEFLGDDAGTAVEGNPEIAMQLICKELGWKVNLVGKQGYVVAPIFNYQPSLIAMSEKLNLIRKVELAVIEKVGKGTYGKWLLHLCEEQSQTTPTMERGLLFEWFEVVATSDAKTRCAALLLCLSEVEDE